MIFLFWWATIASGYALWLAFSMQEFEARADGLAEYNSVLEKELDRYAPPEARDGEEESKGSHAVAG